MIKEILAINPELYLFASPWSPPYWMKTGGSMCGGYMREQYLDCYADYLIKFIKAYAAHGIKVSALTPQNEPDTRQYGKMAACVWHPELEARFIGILRERLVKNGLEVMIWKTVWKSCARNAV
jgi:glucosylceramidase